MSPKEVTPSRVSEVSSPPIQAFLVHEKSQTRFDLPSNKSFLYIGKRNEHIPIQIELSSLHNADIVSRVHGIIYVVDQEYYLEDAGSLNGTSINDKPLKPGTRFRQKLHSGDLITLGKKRTIKLKFEIIENTSS